MNVAILCCVLAGAVWPRAQVRAQDREPLGEAQPAAALDVQVDPLAALRAESEAAAALVAASSPGVVRISSTLETTVQAEWWQRPEIEVRYGMGSGVIVSEDGLVVTNNHVVAGADELEVTLHDGRTYGADLVGSDEGIDLAVIRLRAPADERFDALTLATELPRPGETVFAIGSSYGLGNSVSRGIVSAISRPGSDVVEFAEFVQTDAAVNPGNSVGPLLDVYGRVVGINAAFFSETGGSHGIGFAVPGPLVARIVEQLVEQGHVARGWLGIATETHDGGVRVARIGEGAPATSSGLAVGDLILSVEGATIETRDDLRRLVASMPPGALVGLVVRSEDGEDATIEVELGTRPVD